MIEVVAALIWDNDKFMICQRPENKKRGLMWEFVGGKVESGESREEALIRECLEEIGVVVEPIELYTSLEYTYPDIEINLFLYKAKIKEGEIQKIEHNDIRFILPSEIDDYIFCPADTKIIDKIKEDYLCLNGLTKEK